MSYFEAESPESLQGIHSPRTLLIADESSIISSATFESAGGSLSSENATLILLGNPTRPEDTSMMPSHGLPTSGGSARFLQRTLHGSQGLRHGTGGPLR